MRTGLDGIIGSLHDSLDRAQLEEGNHTAALEKAGMLAQPTYLVGLVRSLRDDAHAAALCASQSYRHPLGFQKLMLINSSPLFDLRLHVWWPDGAAGVEHVHNHRFAFASAVVCGGYDMQLFQADSSGVDMAEYRERVSPAGGWELTPVGTARLSLLTNVRLAAGTSYALAASALHRVAVAPGSLCVTLLLRTMITPSTVTRVFSAPDERVPVIVRAEKMSIEGYRRQLSMLLSKLGG